MDPATVQALRDMKQLLDDGIVTEADFEAKKAELLGLPARHSSNDFALSRPIGAAVQEELGQPVQSVYVDNFTTAQLCRCCYQQDIMTLSAYF